MSLLKNIQENQLTDLLISHRIDLKNTRVKVVFPSSNNRFSLEYFNKERRELVRIFKEIEDTITQRADEHYGDIKNFREVGGYLLIKRNNQRYDCRTVFETTGEKGRQIVSPGRGVNLQWSCEYPELSDLEIDWEEIEFFVQYHSHPFSNAPHPQDIRFGIQNFEFVPENVRYFQTIYAKNWHPKFFWLEHYRE